MNPGGRTPFVDVVHIEDQEGPRGGRVWFLTLACGHHKAVRKPVFRVERDLAPIAFATAAGLARKPTRFEAPHRCRCQLCRQ